MVAQVQLDVTSGASLRVGTGGVRTRVRVAEVTEVDGAATEILDLALTAVGIAYGDPHPDEPALLCVDQDVAPMGSRGARIRYTYRHPTQEEDPNSATGNGVWTFSGFGLQCPEEYRDAYGVQMSIPYTGNLPGGGAVVDSEYHLRTTLNKTQMRASCVRIELAPPATLIRTMMNKINDAPWSDDPARTWLCETIGADPILHETRWRVRYEFLYRPWIPGHMIRGEWSSGGQLPPDVTEPVPPALIGNGIGYFHQFEEADFSVFGLTVPT